MENTIQAKVMRITPKFAERLLSLNTHNRKPRPYIVNYYVDMMLKGLWELNGEPIIISNENTLLDGQHRLMAVVKSGVSIDTLVVTGVPQRVFPSTNRGLSRTPRDIFDISGATLSSTKSSIINRYFTFKAGRISSSHAKTLSSGQEMLTFYYNNAELVDSICSLTQRCYGTRKKLLKYSDIGCYALYLILDKQHPLEYVVSFFEQLFGLKPSENQTIELLKDALITNALGTKPKDRAKIEAYIVKTWNAYTTGRVLKSLVYKPDVESKPVFL